MGLLSFTESYGWKNFMAKLYGFGAAVVIIGALFKIMHWPGASMMLIIGLGTEAVIFFFSAFDPPHEEIDWTLAYPELAGISDEDEIPIPGKKKNQEVGLSVPNTEALQKFDDMLAKAGEKGIFEKLGTGLSNLNDNVKDLKNITDISDVSGEFADNMKEASTSINGLSDSYKKSTNKFNEVSENFTATYTESSKKISDASNKVVNNFNQSSETLNYSLESLNDAYSKSAQKVEQGSSKMANAYEKLTESMNIDFNSLSAGNAAYNESIGTLNKNLSAVNAIFEMQLDDANLDDMIKDIQESAQFSKKYNEEVTKLGKRLEALNNVYGNMLTAMNVNV